ncbi:flagellar basal body-associated protein FliL [Enterobacter sp. CC120223-11]|uniref:flagellar basal body-associated FliL family protein n=1 Tax=Enterobacter sp. CC120223-11 TaxID=1378073 RepID=UPI000BC78D97|nr:flagellar basal body-associated FliL family protein [Enterobacter sp. CC120223-11]SNY67947.1 flagellar FliL protein [Enterobacter sp. CC120223-11]
MNAKTMLFGVMIALITAVCAAAMTVAGMHFLRADTASGESPLSGLFSSTEPRTVEFVEIKNVVITLKGNDSNERYLLLEVNLATSDPQKTQSAKDMIPAIRGATVSLLSDMDYHDVREMSIGTLHSKLKAAYVEKFASLNIPVPFDDVIISKMVFQ